MRKCLNQISRPEINDLDQAELSHKSYNRFCAVLNEQSYKRASHRPLIYQLSYGEKDKRLNTYLLLCQRKSCNFYEDGKQYDCKSI